jgi:hypothetical protein
MSYRSLSPGDRDGDLFGGGFACTAVACRRRSPTAQLLSPNTGARQISQCYGTVMSKLDLTSTALMDALLLDLGELGAVIGALDRGVEGLAGR